MGDNREEKTRRNHGITLVRIFRKYSEEPGAPGTAGFLRSLTFKMSRTLSPPYCHKHKYLRQIFCMTYEVLQFLEIVFNDYKTASEI